MKMIRLSACVLTSVLFAACSPQSDFNKSVFAQYDYMGAAGIAYEPDYDF